MCKYDVNHVIHKTGSTQRIAAPPEEDRLTAIGNCTKKLTLKFGHVVPEICSRTDLGVTQTQTRSWAYIPLSCRGRSNKQEYPGLTKYLTARQSQGRRRRCQREVPSRGRCAPSPSARDAASCRIQNNI